ncbi:uncharacterized protein LOC119725033 [Patiria miniata]|uniref:Uncharacterized protein n=1 Tax=Patiria miniata TaxID=46514 RepID=A0A913ZKI7_PATMI|nr:uncharacterized protein LOC119725033 [Patiria miniata]
MIRIADLMIIGCLALLSTAAVTLPEGRIDPGVVSKHEMAHGSSNSLDSNVKGRSLQIPNRRVQNSIWRRSKPESPRDKTDDTRSILTDAVTNLREVRRGWHSGKAWSGKLWQKDWFKFGHSRRENGHRKSSWWIRWCCKLFWSKKYCRDDEPEVTTEMATRMTATAVPTTVSTMSTIAGAERATVESTTVHATTSVVTEGFSSESTTRVARSTRMVTESITETPDLPDTETETEVTATLQPNTTSSVTPNTIPSSTPNTTVTEESNTMPTSLGVQETVTSTMTSESTTQIVTARPTIGDPVIN